MGDEVREDEEAEAEEPLAEEIERGIWGEETLEADLREVRVGLADEEEGLFDDEEAGDTVHTCLSLRV